MQCRVSRPVKTKPRTCISRFYYIVTTISIGEKTGAGEGFSYDYYHCSELNKLLRLIGFRHVDYHGFGTQKLGAGKVFAMVVLWQLVIKLFAYIPRRGNTSFAEFWATPLN